MLPLNRSRNRSRFFGLAVPQSSLDLDFLSGTLDPRITFTRASSGTFFGSNGLLQTASNDVPRFDYDPVTLAARGLLIEEQRTNLFASSVYTANANGWTNGVIGGTGTIAAASVNNPAATTAGVFNVSGLNGISYVGVVVATTSSTNSYTASVFVRNNGGVKFQLRLVFSNGGTFASFGTEYDFNTGAFQDGIAGTTAPTSRSVTNIGNGWLRITITASDNGTGNTFTNLLLYGAAATTNYNYLIWGAQLEAGAFATSHIPTISSAVTRAADLASMTGTNFSSWYNALNGTVFAESVKYYSGGAGFPRIAQISDNTNNNAIVLLWAEFLNRLYGAVLSATSLQADIGNNGLVQTSIHKSAIAYATNDFAISNDGLSVQTDVSGTVPNVNQLFIGKDAATAFLNGHIRRIVYWPVRVPNTQLQLITA